MESIFLEKPLLSTMKSLTPPSPLFAKHKTRSTPRSEKIKCISQKKSNTPTIATSFPSDVSEVLKDSSEVVTTKPSVVSKPAASRCSSNHGIGISQYLHKKNYFITGATGFLAKALIEKMLRSTPTVGKIYLLIKADDKAAARERLQSEIIDSELFICLKELLGDSYQDFMTKKLVPVVGNVCDDNLGMDADQEAEIASEVDVIINSAANTTFDERYDVAINTNAKGPYRLLTFAKLCKKLQVLMHVSTAYVNGEREGTVLEKPFRMGDSIAGERARSGGEKAPFPMLDIDAEISLAFSASNSSTSGLSQKMKNLGLERAKAHGWQNTYVFTKAMGEMMLDSATGDVPVVIIRPSVIGGIFNDPLPGWIQGNRMLDPMILSYGKGLLPGFPLDPAAVIDYIPADMVVNATLAALVKHGKASKPGLSVYHVSSSVANPLLLGDLFRYAHTHFTNSALNDPNGQKIVLDRMRFFSSADQSFSSYIRDITVRQLKGSLDAATGFTAQRLSERLEAKCRRTVNRFVHLAKIYEPYMFYKGWFDNSNTEKLIGEMSVAELQEFGFNVRNIDWADYFLNVHIPGLRKYVLKK